MSRSGEELCVPSGLQVADSIFLRQTRSFCSAGGVYNIILQVVLEAVHAAHTITLAPASQLCDVASKTQIQHYTSIDKLLRIVYNHTCRVLSF